MPPVSSVVAAGDTILASQYNNLRTDAVSLLGSNLTEATTTSLTAVDLISVSSLSIPATTPILITVKYRKTSGAAAAVRFGLKINSTETLAPFTLSSPTDQAEDGAISFFIPDRVTNYLNGGYGLRGGSGGGSGPFNIHTAAAIPNATITDVVIRALTDNALVTAAADQLRVYALQV